MNSGNSQFRTLDDRLRVRMLTGWVHQFGHLVLTPETAGHRGWRRPGWRRRLLIKAAAKLRFCWSHDCASAQVRAPGAVIWWAVW